MAYCYQGIFGCSKHCFGYHNMINEGEISREEALKTEENIGVVSPEELKEFLRQEIGLSEKEVSRLKSIHGEGSKAF